MVNAPSGGWKKSGCGRFRSGKALASERRSDVLEQQQMAIFFLTATDNEEQLEFAGAAGAPGLRR
jgi:hypothetical protein